MQRTDHYPTDVEDFLFPECEIAGWVAVEDGNLAGHVALHRPTSRATIDLARAVTTLPFDRHILLSRLFVAPEARGRGVARALLLSALGHARAGGLRAVLDVGQEFTAAITLYESEGWTRIAEDRQVVGGVEVGVWVYLSPAEQMTC